jgi:hypothetical protein
MPKIPPNHWYHDPRARRVERWISTLFVLLGLAAAAGAKYAYEQAFQAPACFDYARRKGLAEMDQLRFRDVVIANKTRQHSCIFRHAQREAPVVLRFDDADVPRGRDAGEIAVMILSFALVAGLGVWRWGRWLQRHGYTRLGGFRPAAPAA